MPRKTALVLLLGCATAVLGVVVAAALDQRSLAFTLGVRSTGHIIEIPPGGTGCQAPISVPARFAAIEFGLGTSFRPGPELAVEVTSTESREVLGRGTLLAGYPDNQKHVVPVGDVPAGPSVAVCIRNEGRRSVAVYGATGDATYISRASVDGVPHGYDMDLIFRRESRATMLSLVPDAFDRAALWLPGPVRGWIIWVIAGLVVFVVPALLLRALARV